MQNVDIQKGLQWKLIHFLWDATNWGKQITMQLDQPFAWQHVNLQHIQTASV